MCLVFNSGLILQWTGVNTGTSKTLPIAFTTKAFRGLTGYQYYNNNLSAIGFSLTTVSITGGPASGGYVCVLIIGY